MAIILPRGVLFRGGAEERIRTKLLNDGHIDTYQFRKEETRYSRRVEMDEIRKSDFNLNISRYIRTAVGEAEIDLTATNQTLVDIEKSIKAATETHNGFLKELGLPPLP